MRSLFFQTYVRRSYCGTHTLKIKCLLHKKKRERISSTFCFFFGEHGMFVFFLKDRVILFFHFKKDTPPRFETKKKKNPEWVYKREREWVWCVGVSLYTFTHAYPRKDHGTFIFQCICFSFPFLWKKKRNPYKSFMYLFYQILIKSKLSEVMDYKWTIRIHHEKSIIGQFRYTIAMFGVTIFSNHLKYDVVYF